MVFDFAVNWTCNKLFSFVSQACGRGAMVYMLEAKLPLVCFVSGDPSSQQRIIATSVIITWPIDAQIWSIHDRIWSIYDLMHGLRFRRKLNLQQVVKFCKPSFRGPLGASGRFSGNLWDLLERSCLVDCGNGRSYKRQSQIFAFAAPKDFWKPGGIRVWVFESWGD